MSDTPFSFFHPRAVAAHARHWLLAGVLFCTGTAQLVKAQSAPTNSVLLSDKIHKGNGTINLLNNMTAAQLQSYLGSYGVLMLGADINEAAKSGGIALRNVELRLTTTTGTFVFRDFFTDTVAQIIPTNSTVAQTYYTMFGRSGSSQISSGNSGFNLSRFDDVMEIRNVKFSGNIIGASIVMNFLETAKNKSSNESFFGFSGGFEEFAMLNMSDARALAALPVDLSDAPSDIVYTSLPSPLTAPLAQSSTPPPTPTPPPSPETESSEEETTAPMASRSLASSIPGAPAPPFVYALLFGVLAIWWSKSRSVPA